MDTTTTTTINPPRKGNRRRPGHKACESCKAVRLRCVWKEEDSECVRCRRRGHECKMPDRRLHKSRSGKRLELAKALYGDSNSPSSSTNRPTSYDPPEDRGIRARRVDDMSDMEGEEIPLFDDDILPTGSDQSPWSTLPSTPSDAFQRSESMTRTDNVATESSDYDQHNLIISDAMLCSNWMAEFSLGEYTLSEYSVENMLATVEAYSQLSSHFIEEFFSACQFPVPVNRFKDFREHFEQAGRKLDQLQSPQFEVLAALLISSGARVSSAPCLIGVDVTGSDLSKGDLAYFGRRRAAICEALSERAIRLADERGIFRDESNESISVLMMLANYLDRADPNRIKGRPYRVAAAAHARALAEDKTDEWCSLVDGALAYMLYINDTWTSASSGRAPNLMGSDEDLVFRFIQHDLPTIDELSRALSGTDGMNVWHPVGKIWAYLTRLMRDVDRYLRHGPRSPHVWTAIQEAYEGLDEFKSCFVSMQSSLNQFFISRRPGVQLLRQHVSVTLLPSMLVTYYIRRALKSWIESSYDLSPDNLLRLLSLKAESDRRMAQSARELARLFGFLREILPSRGALTLIPAIEIAYETLPVWAEQLVALPTVEDSVPTSYTLKEKIKEMGWFMDGLHALGWSFADRYLDEARVTVQLGLKAAEGSAAMMMHCEYPL